MRSKLAGMVTWGNPASSNFRKASIRQAKQGDARVDVHVFIRPMTERLLAAMGDDGINISLAEAGSDTQGTSFRLPVDPDQADALEETADALGFRYKAATSEWVFMPDAKWAQAQAEKYTADEEAHLDDPWEPRPVKGIKPGSRDLHGGEHGPDVLAVQWYVGAEPTGVYDEQTMKAVVMHCAHTGLPLQPHIDGEWWRATFPKRITWRRMGEGGREIRLIESALIAFGYMQGPADGRYGVRMQRGVRACRARAGIPGTVKVDRLVWGVLFDLQHQGREVHRVV